MSDIIYDGKRMSMPKGVYHSLEDAMDRYEAENAGKGWDDEIGSPGPLDIVFTQYLRPDGDRRSVWITVPEESKKKANALIAAGYAFECEELTTGMVHLDCCNADRQLANQLVPNGPDIPKAVVDLVDAAHETLTVEQQRYPMEES